MIDSLPQKLTKHCIACVKEPETEVSRQEAPSKNQIRNQEKREVLIMENESDRKKISDRCLMVPSQWTRSSRVKANQVLRRRFPRSLRNSEATRLNFITHRAEENYLRILRSWLNMSHWSFLLWIRDQKTRCFWVFLLPIFCTCIFLFCIFGAASPTRPRPLI